MSSLLSGHEGDWLVRDVRVGVRESSLEVVTTSHAAEEALWVAGRPGTTVQLCPAWVDASGERMSANCPTVAARPKEVAALDVGTLERVRRSMRAPRSWNVQFVSPTVFRSRPLARGSKAPHIATPWPAPRSLANSGRTRWVRWAPGLEAVWPDNQAADLLYVTDVAGLSSDRFLVEKNDADRGKRKVLSGVTGRVRYRCDDLDAARQWAVAWAFMAFVGIGTMTSRGLGGVKLLEKWEDTRPYAGDLVLSRCPDPVRVGSAETRQPAPGDAETSGDVSYAQCGREQ